jgi:hypothetical protein
MTSDAIVSKETIRVRSQAPIALAIMRSRFVSGKEYAVSSYPLRLSPASVFAHFAMGGLFTTEFHLFPPDKTTVRGVLQFFDDDGQPTEIAVRDR